MVKEFREPTYTKLKQTKKAEIFTQIMKVELEDGKYSNSATNEESNERKQTEEYAPLS